MPGDNGEVEVKVPALGAFRIAGRDMLLAVTLLALGSAAISVQWITMRAWEAAISADVRRAVDLHERSQDEHREVRSLLETMRAGCLPRERAP